ncbi:hypothetical protein LNAOJCKE_3029 [Methylorubrum aminovorans]|uniref:Uncharacterized protein n=1 Tax=Methylorubrum aminovorans TaxID=269069 RepID=A0ABQ4UEU1_9HYPH|nr:hypothetical protein [Methylorubrum aminovorans]GJE65816.1 hypothetical protein LNAOJCKE_3029 [Methylorubrum aminovorans]GMA75832.1 hypothetical protein GCM10025880_22490 [Methylorubrum aminovorans]
MVAFLESLPALQALAVVAIGPGVAVLGLAFFVYDAGRLVRLAITGRL